MPNTKSISKSSWLYLQTSSVCSLFSISVATTLIQAITIFHLDSANCNSSNVPSCVLLLQFCICSLHCLDFSSSFVYLVKFFFTFKTPLRSPSGHTTRWRLCDTLRPDPADFSTAVVDSSLHGVSALMPVFLQMWRPWEQPDLTLLQKANPGAYSTQFFSQLY